VVEETLGRARPRIKHDPDKMETLEFLLQGGSQEESGGKKSFGKDEDTFDSRETAKAGFGKVRGEGSKTPGKIHNSSTKTKKNY